MTHAQIAQRKTFEIVQHLQNKIENGWKITQAHKHQGNQNFTVKVVDPKVIDPSLESHVKHPHTVSS